MVVVGETAVMIGNSLDFHVNLACGHFCLDSQPLTSECGLLDESGNLMTQEQVQERLAALAARM